MSKSTALLILKILLWITCFIHIAIGLSLNLDIGLKEWVGSDFYNANVDWSQTQFVYILRPLGAFMITLGIIAAVAAMNPLAHKLTIYAFIILWTLRTLQRIIFWNHIREIFGIESGNMLTGTLVVFISGLLLLIFLQLSQRPEPAGIARAGVAQ